jgi:hypothetical protein
MRRLAGKITDDGLVQRFLVGFAKDVSEEEDRPVDQAAGEAYSSAIKTLATWEPAERVVFRFSADAQIERAAVASVARNVAALPDTSAAFKAHLGKWPGLFARLALTFHLIDAAANGYTLDSIPLTIERHTAAKVAQLMIDYFLPNAARFYVELLGKDQLIHARWIAGYILAHRCDRISARDIGRAYHRLRDEVVSIQTAMETLYVAGWVMVETTNGKGPTRWKVNADVHVRFAPRAAAERTRREAERRRAFEAAQALGLVSDGEA